MSVLRVLIHSEESKKQKNVLREPDQEESLVKI